MDDLWRRSNALDVHKCIVSISESLLEAKTLLEEFPGGRTEQDAVEAAGALDDAIGEMGELAVGWDLKMVEFAVQLFEKFEYHDDEGTRFSAPEQWSKLITELRAKEEKRPVPSRTPSRRLQFSTVRNSIGPKTGEKGPRPPHGFDVEAELRDLRSQLQLLSRGESEPAEKEQEKSSLNSLCSSAR